MKESPLPATEKLYEKTTLPNGVRFVT